MERLSRALIQLNIATREQHGAADLPWVELMVPTVDRHDYVQHLIKVYGFEAALESAFHYTPGLSPLLDLRSRNRSGFIVQDLMRLGMGAARIAELAQRFVTFSSAAEALGWMYVTDRATLLHGAVRRYLTLRIPDVVGASSYLSCCDGIAATRWNDLGGALDAVMQLPWGKRQVIRAALQGFAAHSEWFHSRATALQSIGA